MAVLEGACLDVWGAGCWGFTGRCSEATAGPWEDAAGRGGEDLGGEAPLAGVVGANLDLGGWWSADWCDGSCGDVVCDCG